MGNSFVNSKNDMKLNGGGYTSLVSCCNKNTDKCNLRRKRFLLFVLFFLFSITQLSASELIWTWESTDENIKYYRYKTEIDDEWTVLDSTTTSVPLDASKTTFYLEASYDGINWSESSTSMYSEPPEEDIGFVVISWENTDDYTYLRYQRDGEYDEKWEEIDGWRESLVLPYHSGLNSYYMQSSYDGINWSESSVAYYPSLPAVKTKVIVESFEFRDEFITYYKDFEPSLTVTENEADDDHLSYSWDNTGYNWLRFRINDEPWYLVDTHTTGALLRLIDINKEDAVFQIKGSIDGKKWTERLTINDKDNKYNEAYMNREGWVVSTGFGVYYPYLVAFFTPAKRTINYTTPRELTTDDLKVSFGGDITAAYETEKGNSFGFNIRYIYSPTHKNDPYTSMSLEAAYSRLIVRTPKYNTFQLWLNTGLGPSFCLFQKTGAIGLSCTLGFEARFTFSNNIVLTATYGNTVIIEPNVNERDQLILATTFYTTLPVRIGLSYSFKEVKD